MGGEVQRRINLLSYNQSVVNATYRLYTPAGNPARYRMVNMKTEVKQEVTSKGDILTEVSSGPMTAIEYEPFGFPVSISHPNFSLSTEHRAT